MVTHLALAAWHQWFFSLLQPLGAVAKAVYVPELDFREAVLQKVGIFEDVANNAITPILKADGTRGTRWAVIAFSRRGLTTSNEYGMRDHYAHLNEADLDANPPVMESNMVRMRVADLPVDCAIFCSDVLVAENIEEYLFIYSNYHTDPTTISFNFPYIDEAFPVYSTRYDDISFEKANSKEFGAMSIVTCSFRLQYPVFVDLDPYKIILNVIGNMYLATDVSVIPDTAYYVYDIRAPGYTPPGD